VSPRFLAWPAFLWALAGGLSTTSTLVHVARVRDLDATLSAGGATLGVLLAALLARDGVVSRAIGARARRPQWSARLGLCAALALAIPLPGAHAFGLAVAGTAGGTLLRERRSGGGGALVASLAIGSALALAVGLGGSERAHVGAVVLAIVVAALVSLGVTLRGGPGRPPARPGDALGLVVLGGALALALATR
jgi:hypothetical protein